MSKRILLECLEHESVTWTESFSSFSIYIKKTIELLWWNYKTNSNWDILWFFWDSISNDVYVLESHMDEVWFFINEITNEDIYIWCIWKYNFSSLDWIEWVQVFKVEWNTKYYWVINYLWNWYFKLTTNEKSKFYLWDILAFKRNIIDWSENIIAPSLDNKVWCALNLSIAKNLDKIFKQKNKKLVLVFSSWEEIRQNSSAYFLEKQWFNIKKCYIIDAAYAKPVVTDWLFMHIPESWKWPAIQYTWETFVIPKNRIELIKNIAIENNIPIQEELASISLWRTNQLFFYRYWWDISIINIPVAYQHSIKSNLKTIDYLNWVKLLTKVLENEIV